MLCEHNWVVDKEVTIHTRANDFSSYVRKYRKDTHLYCPICGARCKESFKWKE